MNLPEGVTKLVGEKPGKTVAIFGGTHGNERAGVMTIDHLLKNLKVEAGTVYLVYANPRAIEKNVRYTEDNLNRCFVRNSTRGSYEQHRAEQLMDILDDCDACLDLHSYREPLGESTPFAICDGEAISLTKAFDVGVVVSGMDAEINEDEGATDTYMYLQDKIGICVELGAIEEPEKFVELGIDTAYQFLQHFGCVSGVVKPHTRDQIRMQAYDAHIKNSDDFKFVKAFKTFDPVASGELLAIENGEDIVSNCDGFILFPRENDPAYPIGSSAFALARKL